MFIPPRSGPTFHQVGFSWRWCCLAQWCRSSGVTEPVVWLSGAGWRRKTANAGVCRPAGAPPRGFGVGGGRPAPRCQISDAWVHGRTGPTGWHGSPVHLDAGENCANGAGDRGGRRDVVRGRPPTSRRSGEVCKC